MKHGEVIIVYDVVLVILSITLIILGVLLFICCKKNKKINQPAVEGDEEINCHIQHKAVKLSATSYSLMDIDAATDGFNPRRIIGRGRLGVVYSGVLPDGGVVAVKRFHPSLVLSNAGLGFSSVVRWLSLAHHPHVVPILGFSEAPGERIVVMEFAGGVQSLEFYLHQNHDGAVHLSWPRRLRVAAGAARGLEFLHEGMAPHIVHGCVKPSNVLVENVGFCAKVCDYGLYFLATNERQEIVGYVDDEYWIERRGGSKESDVYGFGVVLLELLSGRTSQEGLLVKWALPLIKEMKFGELLDPRLAIPSDINPLVRLAKVASACVGNSRKSRPTIVQVAAILNNLEMQLNLSYSK